ncbi:MAG TPA: hypothetical protein VGS57_07005 [Thermoanaerobaculia bacterium]|jgi:hypothetical protein|nr:hypothetical protein [Thermoanaerobaculia bacterium]
MTGKRIRPKTREARARRGKQQERRRGRDLEQLVALLEKTLGPAVQVKSPDYLPDLQTGEPREVDVSVRIQAGSTPVLIMAECRDRKSAQDSTWIEQLASKAVSVGAERAIAVSRSGFFAPALEKARKWNIEVRQLSTLTPTTVAEAARVRGFALHVARQHIVSGGPLLAAPPGVEAEALEEQLAELNATYTAPCFRSVASGAMVSLLQLWNEAIEAQRCIGVDVFSEAGVPSDGTHVRRHVELDLLKPAYELPLPSGLALPLKGLRCDIELWMEVSVLAPSTAYAYSAPGSDSLLDTLEYETDLRSVGGTYEAISIHRVPGTTQLSVTRRPLSEMPLPAAEMRALLIRPPGGDED